MNIKVPNSWLKTLLETNQSPNSITEKLSLTGPSVEKVEKVDDDFLYHIEVTTNRTDAFSIWGIAREIYANFKFRKIPVKLKTPQGTDVKPQLEVKELPLKVEIDKKELCPRFTAVILDNVKIASSPPWMEKHLELVGIRSLNNIVDISNYVMCELGQPMHTFDYDKIKNSQMILREAKDGEEIKTLDGQKRKLKRGAVVIEDQSRLIDLCGIMGGENSQIDKKTRRVLLFVQTYDPVRIRKTSQEIGLRTEASSRFEKGLDTEGVIPALTRAVFLLKELAGAAVASKIIDIYSNPYKPKEVTLSKEKLEQYMSIDFPLSQASEILESLGFKVKVGQNQIAATVPSFRANDIAAEVDLIEEIARIAGFDKIPNLLPAGEIKPQTDPNFYWEDRVKNYLKFQGFTEVYTYSMISKQDLEAVGFGESQALKIRNPLNLDLEFMRPTLLPSLLKVVAQNQSFEENLKFFELANRYQPKKERELPDELLSLAGVVQTSASAKQNRDASTSFYFVKGVLEGLFEDLGIQANFVQGEIPNLVQGVTAQILANGEELGRIGKVASPIAKTFGVEGDVFVFGLDFGQLSSLAKLTKGYKPVSKYPQVSEDISMIVNLRTEISQIVKLIKETGGNLLKETEPFDIFTDKKLGENKKSVALHLTYQSPTHNLSTKEVGGIRQKIITALESKLGAKVRLKEA